MIDYQSKTAKKFSLVVPTLSKAELQEIILYLGQIALPVLMQCTEVHGTNEWAIWWYCVSHEKYIANFGNNTKEYIRQRDNLTR